jgi:hypothetical protein
MSINTRHTDIAQASSTVSPERIAQRQRHIRILRAVALVARTKCGVAVARPARSGSAAGTRCRSFTIFST